MDEGCSNGIEQRREAISLRSLIAPLFAPMVLQRAPWLTVKMVEPGGIVLQFAGSHLCYPCWWFARLRLLIITVLFWWFFCFNVLSFVRFYFVCVWFVVWPSVILCASWLVFYFSMRCYWTVACQEAKCFFMKLCLWQC